MYINSIHMNLEQYVENRLHRAIKNNNLAAYLEGKAAYNLPSDPHNFKSEHSFSYNMMIYHEYAKKHPDLELDKKFVEVILERLQSDDCLASETLRIFKCWLANESVKGAKLNTFTINEEDEMMILDSMKHRIEVNSAILKQAHFFDYDDVYGYMLSENEKYTEKTGKSMMN